MRSIVWNVAARAFHFERHPIHLLHCRRELLPYFVRIRRHSKRDKNFTARYTICRDDKPRFCRAGLDHPSDTHTTEILSLIRNANYTLRVDDDVPGIKRTVGSFVEASSFGSVTLGYFAFTLRLWFMGFAVDDIARGVCKLSTTIRSFSSSDQRRRRPVSTTSSRST